MTMALALAAGLLVASGPQAEPPKGWVVEVRGFIEHRRPRPQGWVVEVRGFTRHAKQAGTPKGPVLEFLWPEAKFEPVEGQYHDDLSAFFGQFAVRVEAVETIHVDDLRAFLERLKKER